jgi:uncharacterized protein YggT (Ycf19 family)
MPNLLTEIANFKFPKKGTSSENSLEQNTPAADVAAVALPSIGEADTAPSEVGGGGEGAGAGAGVAAAAAAGASVDSGGGGGGGGALGGKLGSMMSGGMPCEFELTMEFICYFVFTFIIYFCVFAFIPYDKLVEKIFKFIEKITKKFMEFLSNLIPKSVKKRVSSLFPKFIVTFFKKTIPALIKEKTKEITTPLKKKLEEIKKEANKKLNKEKSDSGNKKDIISQTQKYFKEQYIKITSEIKILWNKFNDKILPAIVISLIYYVIWLFFFKFIPTVLKYLINIALNFKNAQMGK